jgi:LEA14-like dessication related protein
MRIVRGGGWRTASRRAAAAGLVAMLAACATLARQVISQPVVSVRQVRVEGLGFTGGSLDVVLGVYNPNHFDLSGTRVTYEVFVDSVSLGTGASDARFAVPGGDSTEVHLPLSFTWAGVGEAGRELMNRGSVPYRVTGDLTVGSAAGNLTMRYDHAGRLATLGGVR